MKLANPFPSFVRELFRDQWACWWCGSNGSDCGGLELNHIYGRISGSALNASLLCKCCHAKVVHNREEHRDLLRKAITYLTSIGYKLRPVDDEFLYMVKTDVVDLFA